MQLKQLFHMLRAAAPEEPAPKAAPKGPGGTFAAVLSGLDADVLQDAPRHVRQALHGMIRQTADGEGDGPVEGLPDGLTDALRHSLEDLLKAASADSAADGAAEGPPAADGTASDAPRLVLKADGTVHLQLPNDRTPAEGDTGRASSGRAPGDTPRYTQPGGPQGQDPAVPADHRVRHPNASEGAKPAQQPAPKPAAPKPAATNPTATSTATSNPTPAAVRAVVEEAITRLAAEGPAAAEDTTEDGEASKAARTGSPTGERALQVQTAGKAGSATPQPGTPAPATSPASPASEAAPKSTAPPASLPFPDEAAPVLHTADGASTDNSDAKAAEPTPNPTASTAPTGDTGDGADEAQEPDANRSATRRSEAPAGSGEGEKTASGSTPVVDQRPSSPPASEKPASEKPASDRPTAEPTRLAPRAPAPAAAPVAEALPDDASDEVRLEAAAQARTEQTPAARTDGAGLALRVDGDAPLQPRSTAPALATADAASASSTSADGGTADQGSDSDPQQRHRDAQALQQALRLARQNGAAAPPAATLASADFSQSLTEALATLPSDTPTVTTTEDTDGEAQVLRHALEGVLSEVKPSRTAPTSRTSAPGPSQANMNAWMKTLMNQPARAFALNNGWQVLQVQLEDGQGSLTVSARRDDDSMAVSVGFTDPALRGQAAAHAGRIQDALQAQYQTQVDFSLQDETQERSSHDRSNSSRTASSLQGTDAEPDAPSSSAASSSVRAALLGANHEWIA